MTCFLWNTNCPLTLQGAASSHVHHNTPKHGQLIHLHIILQGKLSINTRIIAKLYPCFYVHCFCPGFATIDMASNNGILSFETIRRETMVFPFLINGRNFLGGFSPYFGGFFFHIQEEWWTCLHLGSFMCVLVSSELIWLTIPVPNPPNKWARVAKAPNPLKDQLWSGASKAQSK